MTATKHLDRIAAALVRYAGRSLDANLEPFREARASVEALRMEHARSRKLLATVMLAHGLSTGHGETIADLCNELDWQLKEKAPPLGEKHELQEKTP